MINKIWLIERCSALCGEENVFIRKFHELANRWRTDIQPNNEVPRHIHTSTQIHTHTHTQHTHSHTVSQTDAQLFRCQCESLMNEEDCDFHLLIILKCLRYSSARKSETDWRVTGNTSRRLRTVLRHVMWHDVMPCYTFFMHFVSVSSLPPFDCIINPQPSSKPWCDVRSESFLYFFTPIPLLFYYLCYSSFRITCWSFSFKCSIHSVPQDVQAPWYQLWKPQPSIILSIVSLSLTAMSLCCVKVTSFSYSKASEKQH